MEQYTVEALLKATDVSFGKGFDEASNKSEGFKGKVGNAMKTAGTLVVGAAVAMGTSLVAMGMKSAEAGDNIHKASQRMGISTDAYQEMDFWASQNGLSQGNMEKAVGRLNQRIGEARGGNDKYIETFDGLGISLNDTSGEMRNTEDVMVDSIMALSQIDDEATRSAMASELFGTKLARELMPALSDSSLSLEDAKKQAQDLGIVMSEDSVNASADFTDALDAMQRAMGGVTNKIGAAFLPVLTTMLNFVIDNMPQIQAVFSAVFDVVQTVFEGVIGVIKKVIEWLGTFKESNSETFTDIKTTIETTMGNVKTFLSTAWEFIKGLWDTYGNDILRVMTTVFTGIWNVVKTMMESMQRIFETVMGIVVPFVQRQLEKMERFWKQNGEQIMSAVENAFGIIQGIIETVMPIIEWVIEGAWITMTAIFETATGVIMGIIQVFSGLLTGDFEAMKEGAIGIITALWDGFTALVSGAWSQMSGAFSGLWTSISGWFTGLKEDAIAWGSNMIGGFIDGVTSKFRAVGDAVKGVADTVKGWLGFNSPAKKGEGRHIVEWGSNMIEGFLDGVRSQKSEVGKVLNSVIGSMSPELQGSDLSVNGHVAKTGNQMSSIVRHELGNDRNKQPANITLSIGGQVFRAFVQDISDEQGQMIDLERAF